MLFILNLVLSAVNYSRSQPHPWGFGPKEETLSYIGYRTGHIGYALLPLLILFSGRNNFLLWITNWSYSTYILLHRWVARTFAIQAIVHSITLLLKYKGSGSYPTESTEPYWLWGIVATVLTCAMLILSQLYFRRLAYEAFLILHILLAVFVIVGCWYHVILRWGYNFYDNWLYTACAVWFFDRLLRVLRVASNGVRRAVVTEIGPDHVRVDVPGVRWASKPGYVACAYFPTLNPLRPWENHPFSMNSTTLFRSYKRALAPASASLGHSSSDDGRDVEKSTGKVLEASVVRDAAGAVGTTGVTLIIKKNTGLTRLLKSHGRLLTLLDGPYPQNSSSEILKCDHVLLIGGGIGITGLIAWVHAHPNVKLAWSVKSSAEALVKEMDIVLKDMADKEVVLGERLNIEALLRSEAQAGYGKVGVVVSGPGGMCDAVRAGVAGLRRGGKTVFELEVDAYSW
jgi:Ferric reductase like transmembrane component